MAIFGSLSGYWLGNTVGQVFFVQAAKAMQNRLLAQETAETHRHLVRMGLFPIVAAIFAAPDLFSLVLGADWYEAGVYAQYLAPWLFFSMIASPLTRIFDVKQKQKHDLIFSIIMFGIQMGITVWAAQSGDAIFTVKCLSFSGIALRIIHILLLFHLAETPLLTLPLQVFRYLLYALPGEALILGGQYLGSQWLTLAGVIIGWALYLYFSQEWHADDNTAETNTAPIGADTAKKSRE